MKIKQVLFVGLLLSLALVACGAKATPTPVPTPTPKPLEPVDIVKKTMQAVEKMDLDEAVKYVCAAQKDEFASSFDFGSDLAGLAGAALDPDKIIDVMTIKMEDMEYEQTSKDDDKAVVHIKGTMKIEFNKDEFKDLVREVAGTSGEAVPGDAELDSILDMMEGIFGAGTPIDDDMPLVKEDGKWVVCP